jgi:hypothetical protein
MAPGDSLCTRQVLSHDGQPQDESRPSSCLKNVWISCPHTHEGRLRKEREWSQVARPAPFPWGGRCCCCRCGDVIGSRGNAGGTAAAAGLRLRCGLQASGMHCVGAAGATCRTEPAVRASGWCHGCMFRICCHDNAPLCTSGRRRSSSSSSST